MSQKVNYLLIYRLGDENYVQNVLKMIQLFSKKLLKEF